MHEARAREGRVLLKTRVLNHRQVFAPRKQPIDERAAVHQRARGPPRVVEELEFRAVPQHAADVLAGPEHAVRAALPSLPVAVRDVRLALVERRHARGERSGHQHIVGVEVLNKGRGGGRGTHIPGATDTGGLLANQREFAGGAG